MISPAELNPHKYPVDNATAFNLVTLLAKINEVRSAYGVPMIVTSGLRSQDDQARLIADGKSNAPKSHHLTGEAVDIYDPDGKLAEWVTVNLDLMESIGLWMEDFDHTRGWVHFQIIGPKSGNRVFIP